MERLSAEEFIAKLETAQDFDTLTRFNGGELELRMADEIYLGPHPLSMSSPDYLEFTARIAMVISDRRQSTGIRCDIPGHEPHLPDETCKPEKKRPFIWRQKRKPGPRQHL